MDAGRLKSGGQQNHGKDKSLAYLVRNVDNIKFVCLRLEATRKEEESCMPSPYLQSSSQQVLCSCTLVTALAKQFFVEVFESGKSGLKQFFFRNAMEILPTNFGRNIENFMRFRPKTTDSTSFLLPKSIQKSSHN